MLKGKKGEKPNILYVFAGEKAQGAEIVIERLMDFNQSNVSKTHLILSPGKYASDLLIMGKPYLITTIDDLKKLNRSSSNVFQFYLKAIKNYFTVSWKIYRYIKKNNIQIVHSNTIVPSSYLLPLVFSSKLLLPAVNWYWTDHDLKYFSGLETFLANLCAKLYDRTLVVSNAVKLKYPDEYDKITVLYNGLDFNVFRVDQTARTKFRERWQLNERLKVIGIAANINPDKGQLELIDAFNMLSTAHPDVRLIVAGSYASHFPEYAEKVKTAINENANVIYAGFIENIIEFYNGCDLVINNSNYYRSESLGTTIYEAMACERIVIAADTGGTPEIITHKKDGFLFKPENTADLLEMLTGVIENYENLGDLRIAARNKAKSKFGIVDMVKRYNEIIA